MLIIQQIINVKTTRIYKAFNFSYSIMMSFHIEDIRAVFFLILIRFLQIFRIWHDIDINFCLLFYACIKTFLLFSFISIIIRKITNCSEPLSAMDQDSFKLQIIGLFFWCCIDFMIFALYSPDDIDFLCDYYLKVYLTCIPVVFIIRKINELFY